MKYKMKRNIFFYSDPHFGHENIIHYCKRPYKNSIEMEKDFIKKYNYLVQPNDITYWLGDIGFCGYDRLKGIISQMNGIKVLILGNHDKYGITTYYNLGFSAVLNAASINLGQEIVDLNHYPKRFFREFLSIAWLYIRKMRIKRRTIKQVVQVIQREWKRYKKPTNRWNICGHVHEKWKVRGKNINVGVDSWDYTPVRFDKILNIVKGEK